MRKSGTQPGAKDLDNLMGHTLGHGQRARTTVDRQQQLRHGVDCRPHPMRRARETVDRLGFAHLPVLDGAEYRIQLIELYLLDVHLAQKVARKGAPLLDGLDQPVQHCIGIDLKHPRGGTHAQALRQARQHAHHQIDRHPLAVQERAMMLRKVACASSTVELPPRATAGMPVGAKIAQSQPLWGQKCIEVSMTRGRRLVGGIGSGRTEGRGWAVSGSHRAQWGL